MSSKILDLLRDYNATILCRTLPRLSNSRSQKNGTNISDSYKFLLQEKIVSLNNNDGMRDHISEFNMFCVEHNVHMLYSDLLKNIIFALCSPDVVKQLGEQRRQQVIRGIFIKSFQEAANLLIKTPAIFDMAVNRADNCFEPCQQIAANAIETIKMNVFNEEINGIALSTSGSTNIVTVPAKLYETLKKKYDVALAMQTKHNLEMTQAISKIKTLAESLRKAKVEIQALKTRLRDMESYPRELTFSSFDAGDEKPTAAHTAQNNDGGPLSIEDYPEPNKSTNIVLADIDTDDSVSQSGKGSKVDRNFYGADYSTKKKGGSSVVSTSSTSSKKDKEQSKESAKEPSSTTKKTTRKKAKMDDDIDFDPDEFNSFFDE